MGMLIQEQLQKLKLISVNYQDYITFANGITVNSCQIYKSGDILFISYDIKGDFVAGENVIGTIKVNPKVTTYGASRLVKAIMSPSYSVTVYPATTVITDGGIFRLHTSTDGNSSAGSIIVLL